jgi:hypothetical protein
MLIEFSVGNFRSFKDIVTLSMVAAKLSYKDKALDENNVFEAAGAPPLLTSAAIYGANASGKSNLVAAIAFMREFVLNSHKETRPTGAIPVERFRLSLETLGRPSHFEMVFVVDSIRYRYGFEVTPERVKREWLFSVPTTKEARLFERTGDEIVLGERFREGKEIEERTRPNALYLSVVAQFNGPIAQRVTDWFRQIGIASGLQDQGMRAYTMLSFMDGTHRDDIRELIRRLDLGIEDVMVEKTGLPPEIQLPQGVPEALRSAVAALTNMPGGEFYAVRTVHAGADNGSSHPPGETFDLDKHESEGTKKLFAMAGPLVGALKDGKVLVIDELDARLHPMMTREIVNLFNSKQTNPQHAQLIFTTQDTNLLDNRLLRRDQIWFTEKDRQGATQLYSLAEFKVRNDEAFERNYIQGRYGAVPFLVDLRGILAAT